MSHWHGVTPESNIYRHLANCDTGTSGNDTVKFLCHAFSLLISFPVIGYITLNCCASFGNFSNSVSMEGSRLTPDSSNFPGTNLKGIRSASGYHSKRKIRKNSFNIYLKLITRKPPTTVSTTRPGVSARPNKAIRWLNYQQLSRNFVWAITLWLFWWLYSFMPLVSVPFSCSKYLA